MTGKYVHYELATEQIIDITDIIDEIEVEEYGTLKYITNNNVNINIPTTISHYVRATNPAPFIAIYGTTPFADIVKAHNEGRVIKLVKDGEVLVTYTIKGGSTNPTSIDFTKVGPTNVTSLRVTNANVWTTSYTFILNKNQGAANANKVMTVGSDGNVNPTDLPRASSSTFGIVRTATWGGLTIDSDSGDIYVNGATEYDIRQATNGFKALTPVHAEYTVKYYESVFNVVYGTSTSVEIETALTNGRICICAKDGVVYEYDKLENGQHIFVHRDQNAIKKVCCAVANSAWSTTTTPINDFLVVDAQTYDSMSTHEGCYFVI